MRTYTWDEYYEKFYDWAASTRAKNLSYLTTLGDPDEVVEVLLELADENKAAANRLLRKAVDSKMKFSWESLADFFFGNLDPGLTNAALMNSADILTTEDIEELIGLAEDEVLLAVCQKGKIPLPEMLKEDELEELLPVDPDEEDYYEEPDPVAKKARPQKRKIGFWGAIRIMNIVLSSFGGMQNLRKNTAENATAIVPTVHLILDIDTGDGIMEKVISADVNLEETEADGKERYEAWGAQGLGCPFFVPML